MAVKIKRLIAIDHGDSKVARSLTDKPPAHYSLKIDSFSLLYTMMIVEARVQSYESEIFEAGGYEWKLSLYPNGDQGNKGNGFISLYLVMVNTHCLPSGWKVEANLKFFLYDQLQNKYLTIQDAKGAASKFDKKKTGYGMARVVPLCSFLHDGNGYLVNDKCIFGAEVLVKNYIGTDFTLESLGVVKAHPYTWKIDKFSSLPKECLLSDVFTIGYRNWKLRLYPKGDEHAKNNTLALFLEAEDLKKNPEQKTFARVEFRVVNQCGGKDFIVQSIAVCYSKSSPVRGFSTFLPLTDLYDASKGFLLKDTLILRATVEVFYSARSFLKMIHAPDLAAEQFEQTMVQNQGLKKPTAMNFSGTSHTAGAKATKLPQAKAKVTSNIVNSSSKNVCYL